MSKVATQQQFDEYKNLFVQRLPRYAVKFPGDTWHTRQLALHDKEIQKHLSGQQSVAVLGRWYPEYAALDLDSVPMAKVEQVRYGLGLDENNSLLYSSESPDSYHLYFRPRYNEKPPTINLLQTVLKPYATAHGVEIYPQKNRAFRLPFGKGQECLDYFLVRLDSLDDKLYWLKKMDDFDLSEVKHQPELDLRLSALERWPVDTVDIIPIGESLLASGLQGPSTRDEAQFQLVKYLWRLNVPSDQARVFIWRWLCQHHNGYSKDFFKHPQTVKQHIKHQVDQYYNHMVQRFALPDGPHKSHKGYICKDDLIDIIALSEGNLPRMRFLFELIRYMNPRRYRQNVSIHRNKYVEWSSNETYKKHLSYLTDKGILKQGAGYLVGKRSKSIDLKWKYRTDQEAVLFNGRAVETLESAVSLLFKKEEFAAILRNYCSRQGAYVAAKRLYEA